jgi:hypothetical protein
LAEPERAQKIFIQSLNRSIAEGALLDEQDQVAKQVLKAEK